MYPLTSKFIYCDGRNWILNYGGSALTAFSVSEKVGRSDYFESRCSSKGKSIKEFTGDAKFVLKECELFHIQYI